MSTYKKFDKTDVFTNRVKSYPKVEFFIYDRKVYYNNKGTVSGAYVSNVCHTDVGNIPLYEENVDRPANSLIYPWIVKGADYNCFKSVSVSAFDNDHQYGDKITGSYPLSASISVDRFSYGQERLKINSLENSMNSYRCLSKHYEYGDKATQKISLISIPSIFYGSSIKKGSVDLKYYIDGTLASRLQDIRQNGELIQTYGASGTGSVAGVCLYGEGEIILTGAWNISTAVSEVYDAGSGATYPKWLYFASTGSAGVGENISHSSFNMTFNGTSYTNTITMFCHAQKGEVNNSNNPTWIEYGKNVGPTTSSADYVENRNIQIKNTVKGAFVGSSGSFEKQVFINKVVIYDKDKRPIGVAQLSRPIKKREQDQMSIKIKIDI